ncbi:bifunctional DedA family/phosphatase PAP2 family protein [Loktanella sp. M215]|uniref:bifunctional DedA family/phosphatase PAP2 family protein n=1 Tax=Loktanella sp. M215 TaxID=2675431 RepID=UPI001F43C279|nr:phosphatase PAP2 family protein [Loktanella sp. M215]MCF7697808.1 phosphatase PAP2 family protein [Loktanella sp. M215]
MPDLFSHLLPAWSVLGSGLYAFMALLALAHAVVLIGFCVPLTAIVVAAGVLAQRGYVDPAALVWSVALGSWAGCGVSYLIGRLVRGADVNLRTRAGLQWATQGGPGLIRGRLSHGTFAFVPFGAGRMGGSVLRVMGWSGLSAAGFALVAVLAGMTLGRVLGALGAAAPRLVVLAVILTAILLTIFVVLRRIGRVWPDVARVIRAVALRTGRSLRVRALIDRHPRWSGFFAARFGTERFLGLTATVLGVLLIYVVGAYVASVTDFLGARGTVTSDTRIANLLYAIRDDRVIAVLGWITEVGGRHGVLPMLAGATLALLVLRRYDLLGGMWIAAAGNQITVTLLKGFFARPRSDLGYYTETSGSFPSGHAAGAVAVWAMLFYLAWRLRLLPAGIAGFLAATTVVLIGLSRVYLVEHYVSDVLNGYLVGGLWLILGIAFCEWRRRRDKRSPTALRRWGAALCMTVAAVAAIVIATRTVSPMNTPIDRPTTVIATLSDVLAGPDLTRDTEALSGTARQLIELIVETPDAEALTTALTGAGWQDAPRPSLWQLAQAGLADWTGSPLPQPLVVPTFWDNRPSALGFAWPEETADGLRLHLRFWDSLRRTPEGAMIYVGNLTAEDPLDWTMTDDPVRAPDDATATALAQVRDVLAAAGLQVVQP